MKGPAKTWLIGYRYQTLLVSYNIINLPRKPIENAGPNNFLMDKESAEHNAELRNKLQDYNREEQYLGYSGEM